MNGMLFHSEHSLMTVYGRHQISWGFAGSSDGKESAHSEGDPGLIPGREIPWRREWLPTPVFFPREFHGQRSLAAIALGVVKSWDMTEQLTHTLKTR